MLGSFRFFLALCVVLLLLLAAIGAFGAVWKASTYDGTATTNPYYYAVILVAATVSLMFHGIRASGPLGHVDRWLGDLSYPVFLIHYPAGYLVWLAIGQPDVMRSWTIARGPSRLPSRSASPWFSWSTYPFDGFAMRYVHGHLAY